jgi:hypothetical protein
VVKGLLAAAILCQVSVPFAGAQNSGSINGSIKDSINGSIKDSIRGFTAELAHDSETAQALPMLAEAPLPAGADLNAGLVTIFKGSAVTASAVPERHDAWTDDGMRAEGMAGREGKAPVESNLVIEALASYGHYKIFASGSGCKLYTAGVEYDRHSFGRFLGARFDYVAEFLPVVLLYAPKTQDIWGTATSPEHKIVPAIGISPIGIRWLWRDKKAVRPYLMGKGGMLGFTQKALSQKGTYENFSLQSAVGLNVEMNPKWDLRLGLFSDFHFSNAFIVPVNPGLDVMNANLGLSYNFRR